jgi:CRISPR-associated endonuclease/helicase Cas3
MGSNKTSPNLLAHEGQPLQCHLKGVAQRAKTFAEAFDGGADALLAGWLHDIGKADTAFQKRIASNKDDKNAEKKPHAPQGAALALEHDRWPVAFTVNAHHAGLHDRAKLQQVLSRYLDNAKSCLSALDAADAAGTGACADTVSASINSALDTAEKFPAWLNALPCGTSEETNAKMRAVELYTRLLFSALVDADRLDTEEANPADGAQANVKKRRKWRFGAEGLAKNDAQHNATTELSVELQNYIFERAAAAKKNGASQSVLETRAQVLAKCEMVARQKRGIFTLTVPTGGGKTLASVKFALEHIKHNNTGNPRPLRRIIIVIPYANIIQQTTSELQKTFGDLVKDENGNWVPNRAPEHKPLILEHHSQASDPEIKTDKNNNKNNDFDAWDKERSLRQLAVENWDAPIIVTTSVQFFDSLFSRRPADARKLHNICQSVIIFDEIQTLPPLLLQPILDVLKEFTNPSRPYGCSLLFCTATQPALSKNDDLKIGFENVISVIGPDECVALFSKLKRVEYRGLSKTEPPPKLSFQMLAEEMLKAPNQQALAILNTRKQARKLFEKIKTLTAEKDGPDNQKPGGAVFHLSTWMYPAHRLQVLAEVSRRLAAGEPCFLVATQCVEAGVDVDFPAVWRAFGPYDSIVQAAGRCNRNGKLEKGIVTIFTPEDAKSSGGVYASAIGNTDLLRKLGKVAPDDPASFEIYFRLFYQTTVPDAGACVIQKERGKLHFEKVSELFRFIDADTVPLVIETAKMDTGKTVGEWLKTARQKQFLTPGEWREIQPFIVNLSFPLSDKTRTFLQKTNSELVFKDDDPVRGLRRMKLTNVYEDGINGAGLDTNLGIFNEIVSSL